MSEERMTGELRHPERIDCDLHCEVPERLRFVPVPRPRHAWRDVACCPNEGCGRAFLMRPLDEEKKEAAA